MADNPFDQFDEQAKGNPFDVFDKPAAPQPAEAKKPEDVGVGEYLWNQVKMGITDTPALIDLAAKRFGTIFSKEEIAKTLAPFAFQGQAAAPEVVAAQTKPVPSSLLKQYEESQAKFAGITGAQPEMRAPGPISKIAGAGVRAASDPLAYLGGLGLIRTPIRAAGEFMTGAAADIGSDVGAAAERAITGEDTGIGRVVGGLGAGLGTGVPRQAALDTIERTTEQIRRNRQILEESPGGAQKMFAKGAAKNLLTLAAQQQGVQSVDELLKLANEASQFVNKSDSPLVIAMADNPVIRQQVERLAKTNAVFGQKVNDLLAQANADIENKVTRMFGERYAAGKIPPEAGIKISGVKRRVEDINKELSDVAETFTPNLTNEQVGRRIEKLVENKKKAARDEVSPDYDAVLNEARSKDIKMPPEGVASIHNFVVENNLRDIFGKGTPVDRKIMSYLEPEEVEAKPGPALLGPDGEPISPPPAKPEKKYPELSFDNVDSLKKEINKIQRGRMSDDARRKINQLEDIVDEARKTIPGDYNDRLIAADRKYLEKVGIPFSEQGIRDIDSKKYAEQVAPVIVKNPESYSQFIRAVGPEKGNVLAENAIISEVYDKAVKDGTLNPRQLEQYLKDNAGVISKIPGLEEKLRGALLDDRQLRGRLDSLNDAAKVAQKRVADNALTSVDDVPDYNELASSFINVPVKRRKILKNISDLDPDTAKAVRNTLRAEIVNIARSSSEGFLNYITNPKNKAGVEAAFGSAFQDSLKKIARFSDKVGTADISKIGVAIRREELDALQRIIPGVSIPYLTSNWRDRVSSFPHKVIRVFSKYNSANLVKATDDAIMELLLDPNGVQKLANTITDVKFKIDNPVAMKKLAESLSKSVPRAFYTGTKTAAASAQQEQLKEQAGQERAADFVVGGFEDEEPPKMQKGGLVEPGNIDTAKLPVLRNPDGTVSTVSTIGIGTEDGLEVVIPTIINGRRVSEEEARKHYEDTHQHFGIFNSVEAANAFAQKLHEQEAQRTMKKARGGVIYTPAEQRLLMRYASR